MEAIRTGEDFLKGYGDGTKGYADGTLLFRTMGRKGGSKGKGLAQDLASGGGRRRHFPISEAAFCRFERASD